MSLIRDTDKYGDLNFTNPSRFHSFEAVDRGSETQLKVTGN